MAETEAPGQSYAGGEWIFAEISPVPSFAHLQAPTPDAALFLAGH
jgi:hypothetical protein